MWSKNSDPVVFYKALPAIPLGTLVSAITRDANGDGYIDTIELTFSKPTVMPADFVGGG